MAVEPLRGLLAEIFCSQGNKLHASAGVGIVICLAGLQWLPCECGYVILMTEEEEMNVVCQD